jgi:hypothetical protein
MAPGQEICGVADPEASIVLVASRGADSVVRVMDRLRHQSAAPRLELVIAARPEHVVELTAPDPAPLGALTVIPADLSTTARARAAAIPTVRAPVVIFAEDHAFPRGNDWAERLMAAHAGPWAGVGPAVDCANPGTSLSCAVLVAEYGPWIGVEATGEVDALPGHNSAYKRAALMACGDRLCDLLEAEWVLQRHLRERGGRFLLLHDVIVDHVSFSRLPAALGIMFRGGWMFAASRAEGWSRIRGAAWALAAPAIFGLRMQRCLAHLRRRREAAGTNLADLAALALMLAANAAGEAIGHAVGDCGLRHELGRRECDRWRHVRSEEEATLFRPA